MSANDDPGESEEEPEMLSQPETRPISHEQLVVEVKGIYAGLVMVEAKCIDIDERQSAAARAKPRDRETWSSVARSWYHKGAETSPTNGSLSHHLDTIVPPDSLEQPSLCGTDPFESIRDSITKFSHHHLSERDAKDASQKQRSGASRPKPPEKLRWMDYVLGFPKSTVSKTTTSDQADDFGVHRDVIPNETLGNGPEESRELSSLPTRRNLPMIIGNRTIQAQHDTGAERGNYIASDFVKELNLTIRMQEIDRQTFSMGNGKVARAIGRVKASCAFAKEPQKKVKCWFYVFQKLASPLIIGSKFLKKTKTMSHFTNRLGERFACAAGIPVISLISSTDAAKRRLAAFVDDRPTYINADSGSDLDVMSPTYTKLHGYRIDRRRQCRKRVQFADTTEAETIGQVRATITLKNGSRFEKIFDVLPGLTSDVLLGDATLEEMEAFTFHENSFVDVFAGQRHFDFNVLTYIGRVGEFVAHKMRYGRGKSQAEEQRKLFPTERASKSC